MDDALKQWVQQLRSQGYTDEQIISAAIQGGRNQQEIDEVIKPTTQAPAKKNPLGIVIISFVLIIVLCLGGLTYLNYFSTNENDIDKEPIIKTSVKDEKNNIETTKKEKTCWTAMGTSTPEYETLISSSEKTCSSATECGEMFNKFAKDNFIIQKESNPDIDVEAAMAPILEQTELYVQVGYIQCAVSKPPSIACETTADCEDDNPCTAETCIALYSGSYCDYQIVECS